MVPTLNPTASTARRPWQALACAALLAGLAACGGGGDGGSTSYVDANRYSTAATASLSTPNENTSVTHHAIPIGGASIAYTATAGHLTARDGAGTAEASFFYVAYTADGAPAATRPVTFLFNGGPGSATIWLHLGSWAPKRLVTGVPATTQATPFPYVENSESLIDTTDLVFVDAVGTGLSEAIAPRTNQSFWGVDADAGVVRDFVLRWLAANGREASPLFLYGESYATVRVPVTARLLETAGTPVAGVILHSSVLNYASNCSMEEPPTVSCAGALPSYAAVGAYFGLVVPAPADEASFLAQVRAYADTTYDGEAAQWLALGGPASPPPGADVATLVADTGLAAGWWNQRFDMDYDTFRHHLIPGMNLGVYDGRVAVPVDSPLNAGDEPSDAFLAAPFAQAMGTVLQDELGFTTPSTYVMTSNAIETWDFSHAGHPLPDVVPDLAATIALDPSLRILSIGGFHDLITPFHQTELDLAGLDAGAPVTSAFFDGGHMTYLDDRSRPLLKASLAAFYAATPGAK